MTNSSSDRECPSPGPLSVLKFGQPEPRGCPAKSVLQQQVPVMRSLWRRQGGVSAHNGVV
jgi:hypothetical protein